MKSQYVEADIRKEYQKLTELLIKRQMTITTMESATSGQIASLLTDTEGASAILKGAYVTYSNEAKIMQGVPAEIMNQYSVYSKETAAAMAEACARAYGANIGIGVTGSYGNIDPANPEDSVPGQVYYAIRMNDRVASYAIEIPPQPSRLMYKLATAKEVCDSILELMKKDGELADM